MAAPPFFVVEACPEFIEESPPKGSRRMKNTLDLSNGEV